MEIIPAIDLREGRCVRLEQGDYDRMTVYGGDPAAEAARWVALGARRLHVVDLDGAASGQQKNEAAIQAILRAVDVPIQVGGGIRTLEAANALFDLGVDRAVFGTVAIRQPELIAQACSRFGGRVVVGIDARDGFAAIQGWRETSDRTALELAREMAELGVQRIIYTDVERDGMLDEPNFDGIGEMIRASGLAIIASGGVCRVEHIARLAEIGAEGAIVGKALYSGKLDLPAALAACPATTGA